MFIILIFEKLCSMLCQTMYPKSSLRLIVSFSVFASTFSFFIKVFPQVGLVKLQKILPPWLVPLGIS